MKDLPGAKLVLYFVIKIKIANFASYLFMDISVIIPLLNEEESLPELHDWIVRVMQQHNYSYEIVFVDDGSKGKSPALHVGFEAAEGNVVITMDADLQDSPDEIPELYNMITQGGFDLVSGWKQKRYDNAVTKNLPSKLYNWTNRKISGIQLHDMNCGLKAYKKEVIKSIEIYGEMHRFIPVLAKNAGFDNITEKTVQHQARKYGTSKFGWDRFINGFLDLLTITFLSKFGKRPMHLFGTLGTFMFIVGFFVTVYLGGEKLYCVYNNQRAPLVASNPLFFIALTTMVLGTLLFLTGFVGELILRNSSVRNHYLLEKKVNL